MADPEFMMCLSCDTPTYSFEFQNDKVTSIMCTTCGADDPSDFVTESEYEMEDE